MLPSTSAAIFSCSECLSCMKTSQPGHLVSSGLLVFNGPSSSAGSSYYFTEWYLHFPYTVWRVQALTTIISPPHYNNYKAWVTKNGLSMFFSTKCLLYFICYVLKDILADLLCFTDVCLRLYKASCATLIHWGCMLVHFILIINGTKSVWILYYVNHTQCKCPESYDQKLWKYCKNV